MATAKLVKKLTQLVIKVPDGSQWDFMKAFGLSFKPSLNSEPLSVDKYHHEGDACYITVSLYHDEEQRFYDFCRRFFNARGIKTELEIK